VFRGSRAHDATAFGRPDPPAARSTPTSAQRTTNPLPRRRRRHAVTLIELLVVLSIISILLSIGVGVYFGFARTTALQGEMRRVIAVIQMARSTAISENAETFVAVDADENQLYPFGRRRVGVWHFEMLDTSVPRPRSVGAFSYAAVTDAGTPTLADGKIGKALAFDGSTVMHCKRFHRGQDRNIDELRTRDGVGIEAWIYPTGSAATQTIVHSDGWFALWLVWDDGEKRFALHGKATTLDVESGDWEQRTASTAAVVRANAWTHVTMNCHRLSQNVSLAVNGRAAVANSAAGTVGEPSEDTATAIGAEAGGGNAFHGRIDEVILSAYILDRVQQISGRLKLGHANLATGDTIRFDPTGRLSSEHDGSVPTVYLREYDKSVEISRVTVTVGVMGTIDVDVWHK
jgi:prepilin-type N-terminal cleavage/methylation domain-containing protein